VYIDSQKRWVIPESRAPSCNKNTDSEPVIHQLGDEGFYQKKKKKNTDECIASSSRINDFIHFTSLPIIVL